MKKLFTLFTILIMMLSISTLSYADSNEDYYFELTYEGDIVENEPKAGVVKLIGVDGTLHTNVRIKVDASGPTKPEIIAYDSNGAKFDIAEIGYWGPASGFPVQGTFTNETPVTVTYSKAGKYTTTLQLVDLTDNNAIITSKEFTINVLSANTDIDEDNKFDDENVIKDENIIDELPQAGINLVQCSIYLLIVASIFFIIKKKKSNSSN